MLASLLRLADFARHQGRMRSWEPSHAIGRRGEDIAHRFLERAGMTVVARNHATPGGSGEVDLIAWDKDVLVFVEVKCRATDDFGPPARAIDDDKLHRILRAARDYARRAEVPWEQVRFDTVTIVLKSPPDITHCKDVFTAKIPVLT